MGVTTTSPYGRGSVAWPDFAHDGGTALHTKITNSVAEMSNNQDARWTGDVTLANSAFEDVAHNFDMPLNQLSVRIYEGDSLISLEDQQNNYVISQVDTNTVRITNQSGGSKTFFAYVWGFSLERLLGRWSGRTTTTTTGFTGLLNIPLRSDESAMVRYMISARKDGTNACSYELLVQCENNGGTMTITEMRRTELEDVTSMDVQVVQNGNEVRLEVKGDGTNVDWSAVGETTYF